MWTYGFLFRFPRINCEAESRCRKPSRSIARIRDKLETPSNLEINGITIVLTLSASLSGSYILVAGNLAIVRGCKAGFRFQLKVVGHDFKRFLVGQSRNSMTPRW